MGDKDEDDRVIRWSNQLETIIAQEGEKCRGLAWIHQHAETIASSKNNYIQIPSIVLSTLTGATSISSTALFGEDLGPTASKVLGFVSIGIGILNTLGNYFAFARKSEAHHIAYLHYSKLFSWISVELALPREERMSAEEMLKSLRRDMERLAETTPLPPDDLLKEFAVKFKSEDVSKPAETNGLAKIQIYRQELASPNSSLKINIPQESPKLPA
ncbi:MAG: Dishui lake phycodnavirus 1 [Pseudomonadota bacterium]